MHSTKNRFWAGSLSVILILNLFFSACTPDQATSAAPESTNASVPTKVQTPTATPIPLPEITLKPGEMYFRVNGKPAFVFSRNLAGLTPRDYEQLVASAQQHGTLVVRVGVDNQSMSVPSFGYGFTNKGEIVEEWSDNWEHFFEVAEAKGIYVMPFFTGWFNWNSELDGWDHNPFNVANGGPAKDGTEFLKQDSPTQTLYLKWFKEVISRWQKHENILAWEVASEINLIPGASEQDGIYFVERSAAVIQEADPHHRPVTVSLGGFPEWREVWWLDLYRSDAIAFTNIHPYPPSGHLDTEIIRQSRMLLEEYGKPVLNGESGLNAAEPNREEGKITVAKNADLGIKHAVWAGTVSGAMNGRALFWEDSYGIYFPALGGTFLSKYKDVELPAANFMKDMDMTGFVPLTSNPSGKIVGAALGNETMVIGWFRDAGCEPPDWPLQPLISGQSVIVIVPGSAQEWIVDFYDTQTGTDVISSATVTRQGDRITITLPDFTDDIAFKMYPR
jgi:hypothetical protein